MDVTEAALAVFEVAARKGGLHVTGDDGSDRLVGFFVPADAMNDLGRALVAAGARLGHGDADPELSRWTDSVLSLAYQRGVEVDRLDREAVLGVVAMAREEWPAASPNQLYRGIDWHTVRLAGETREDYVKRTGS